MNVEFKGGEVHGGISSMKDVLSFSRDISMKEYETIWICVREINKNQVYVNRDVNEQ